MALKDEAWRHRLANYPIRFGIETRYSDMDANAHLNNVRIAGLLEEARVRFHHRVREEGGEVSPGGIMVAHISIDYLAEGKYPEAVEAGVAILQAGNSSYRMALSLFQQDRAFVLADCVMVQAAPTGGKMQLADEYRTRLLALAPSLD